MKRFLVVLLLFPSLAFGAYTEFYCDAANGNNLYAGSTTSTTPYTKTSGNWVQATRVYTVQDGTNPSSSVNVGDYASVYPNGTSAPAVYIGRITAVQNATNGTITIDSTAIAGSAPANSTGGETIVVGGVWKGPTGASGFPFSISSVGALKDASGNQVRVNMKNNSSYSITASYAYPNNNNVYVTQGYSSSPGDGGKATIDGSTSTGAIITSMGTGAGHVIADIIFTTSITTGTNSLVATGTVATEFIRCVFKGARNTGLNSGSVGSAIIESEIYDCNKANSANISALSFSGGIVSRTFVHDNSGSNTEGIRLTGSSGTWVVSNCVIDTNGNNGITVNVTTRSGLISILNNDIYNNGADGIGILSGTVNSLWIENTNLIKNTGAGINNASAASNSVNGFVFNCGYGAGTQANGSSDTLGNLVKTGTVTYPSNVAPWADGPNGNFNLTATQGFNVGRGAFTETQGYSSPNTVGYPDIGAANHNDTCGGTGPCQTSSASSY